MEVGEGGRKKTRRDTGGGGGHGDNLVQLQVRRPDRRPATIPRWPSESSVRRRYFWCGTEVGHSLYVAPLALDAEAPEGRTTRVCGRRAGGGQVPLPRVAREERPVVFCWPPSVGRASRDAGSVPEYKLEREREKTLRQH